MNRLQFRVSGIPVRVEPIFVIVMTVLAFANGRTGVSVPIFVLIAGVSILLHELGHATAHRSFGAASTITLTSFGGVTVGPRHPGMRSTVVALAGPGTGFLVGALAVALSRVAPADSAVVKTAFDDLIWINIFWGVVNLLPLLPLDGGHVAEGLFGERIARYLSLACAGAIGVYGFTTARPFLAIIAFVLGSQSLNALRFDRDRPQLERLDQARVALLQGRTADALALVEGASSAASSFVVEVTAAELAAWAHLADGKPEEARAALTALRGGVSRTSQLVQRMVDLAEGKQHESLAPAFVTCDDVVAATIAARMVCAAGLLDRVLEELRTLPPLPGPPRTNGYRALQLGLHHAGRYRDAAKVGDLLFQLEPAALVAYNTACSWALAGDTESALTWLDRAVEHGFRDTALLDRDNNFDTIRDTDGFRAVRSWMETGPPGGETQEAAGS